MIRNLVAANTAQSASKIADKISDRGKSHCQKGVVQGRARHFPICSQLERLCGNANPEGLFRPVLQKDWTKQQIVAHIERKTIIDN